MKDWVCGKKIKFIAKNGFITDNIHGILFGLMIQIIVCQKLSSG